MKIIQEIGKMQEKIKYDNKIRVQINIDSGLKRRR